MNNNFDKIKQLELLLERYPDDDIDYEGIILDYLGETQETVYSIFDKKPRIYKDLFCNPGKKTTAINLLKSTVKDQESFNNLYNNCRDIFPKVTEILDEIRMAALPLRKTPKSAPDEIAGFPVNLTIWQISDVHFGKFNTLDLTPTDLASILVQAAFDFKLFPDLILVSGDLTSCANEDEFNQFLTFAKELSESLWEELRPGRFLVVPGNHDITWLEDGTSDKLSNFRKIFENQDVCITPVGKNKEKIFEDGNIIVDRIDNEAEKAPPFALVRYPKVGFEVLLLTSCYYSGEVPEKVRQILSEEDDSDLKGKLYDLLRVDEGEVSHKYLANLAKYLPDTSVTRIGLTHHNTCPIGKEQCPNKIAQAFMDSLFRKNIRLLFHGHVHQMEERDRTRPSIARSAYPVPCTSLASYCHNYNRGFNIHFVGNNGNRSVATYGWELSGTGIFEAAKFSLLYDFNLDKDELVE